MRLFHQIDDFELETSEGKTIKNTDFLGKYLVLYFYPKANTSGCTVEAQDFTAQLKDFADLDAEILGVSPDSIKALCRFIDSKKLGITLASDPDKSLAKAYDALKPTGGILRSTFLIDRNGTLRYAWKNVKVAGHAEQVFKMLKELSSADSETLPAIAQRRSKRALLNKKVSKTTLKKLVESATLAPSCFNHQPWRIFVATDKTLEKVKTGLSQGNSWAQKAPAIIAFSSHRDNDCQSSHGRDYFWFDNGLAAQNLMIQATQMGLIAHPIAGFDPPKVKEALGIPEGDTLITLIIVGWPGSIDDLDENLQEIERSPRQRKPLDEVVFWKPLDD